MTNLSKNLSSSPFDAIRRFDQNGNEFWTGRELMPLLGYVQWRRFEETIDRAKISCQTAGFNVKDHFNHLPGSASGQRGRLGVNQVFVFDNRIRLVERIETNPWIKKKTESGKVKEVKDNDWELIQAAVKQCQLSINWLEIPQVC